MITLSNDGLYTLTYTDANGQIATVSPAQYPLYGVISSNLSAQIEVVAENGKAQAAYMLALADYEKNLADRPTQAGNPPAKPDFKGTNDVTGVVSVGVWNPPLPDPIIPVIISGGMTGLVVAGGSRKPDPSEQLTLIVNMCMSMQQVVNDIKAKLNA